uniref:SP110 nuclear antigen, tandem duplicate 3 n=1 Tax=Sparus aurata TaxID=8175 RepID=A0A671WMG1_SPAAU
IWTWAIYRFQLPVTCGHQNGFLNRQKCIVVDKQWFTPNEFERLAGKESFKNWKSSIRCAGTTLGKLIQEETEEQTKRQSEARHDSGRKVFRVTCGALTGTLHKHRFASGRTCGKSIRTETSWMTPMEFVKEASGRTDRSWRKDIEWEGQPLGVLTEVVKASGVSYLLASCLSRQDEQKNDDVCCICKSEGEEALVMCDCCPRSFHKKCHLPHVEFGRRFIRSVLFLLPQLSDYSSVIETPMWLGSVADKLQKHLYQTVGEFVSDVQLVFTNCASYNRVRNRVHM